MIERAVLDKWRAEAKSLEHPQAHPDMPRPGGYEASQRMLALIAEIDRLDALLREIQKINGDGFKAPEVATQLIAEIVEAALA